MAKNRPTPHEGPTPPSPSWPNTLTLPEIAFAHGLPVDHVRWAIVGHALHEISEAAGLRRQRISYGWQPWRLGRRVVWGLRCWPTELHATALHFLTCPPSELPYPEAWAKADREEAERRERKRAARKRQRQAKRAREAEQAPSGPIVTVRRRPQPQPESARV